MSAASFLGIAGLIFLFGFDGFLYSVGFLVAFLTVLFLLGERMRNSGKYTIADVLSFRMKQRPARSAAALGTLSVAGFYLIAQMVGAGVPDPGARRHRLHPVRDPHGCLHDHLHRHGRHARDELGPDHQGRPADDRDDRAHAVRARRGGLEPDQPVHGGARGVARRARPISSRACSCRARSTRCRSASRSCSAPPGCRTS